MPPEGSGRPDPDVLLLAVAERVEALGPFAEDAVRADKWRTTEQLLHELNPAGWSLDELDKELLQRERAWEERLKQGLRPNTRIRRAYYPDRTTVLPLWGATQWLGEPTAGMSHRRDDPPHDLPEDLRPKNPEKAPVVFLSYSSRDHDLAMRIARDTAGLDLAPWMFETHIDHQGEISESVRGALEESACFIGIVTRDSMASLWMLTELHSAYEMKKPLVMVFDASDDQLVHLLRSVEQGEPDENLFDHGVRYCRTVVEDLAAERDPAQAETYQQRVGSFLAGLPLYQAGGAAVAYPDLPSETLGPLTLAPFAERMRVFRPAELEESQ